MPTIHDFPLWRVGCRVRLSYIFIGDLFKISFKPDTEEDAVFSLLARVDEKYRIQSAFMRGSKQGWIYLEGHMDTNVIQLLKHSPGIIHEGGCKGYCGRAGHGTSRGSEEERIRIPCGYELIYSVTDIINKTELGNYVSVCVRY